MATGSDAELLAMALDPDVLRVLARETYKPLILGTCITLMVVVTTAVTLRICARRIAKVRLQAEDWTILLAMTLNNGFAAIAVAGTTAGWGMHLPLVLARGPDFLALSLKYCYAFDIFYQLTACVTRLSILLFYRDLFRHAEFYRRALHLVIVLVVAQSVAFLFVVIFQCRPIEAFWDRSMPGAKCLTRSHFLFPSSLANVLADAVTLMLPIPVIWSLQLDMRKRVAVCALFMLGGVPCIFAILRAPDVNPWRPRLANYSYDGILSMIYSVAESSIGIVCACIPLLAPLFKHTRLGIFISRIQSRSSRTRSNGAGKNYIETSMRQGSKLDQEEYHKLKDFSSVQVTGGESVEPIVV